MNTYILIVLFYSSGYPNKMVTNITNFTTLEKCEISGKQIKEKFKFFNIETLCIQQ